MKILLCAVIVLAAVGAAWRTSEPTIGTDGARWLIDTDLAAVEVALPDPHDALNVSGSAVPSVHAVSAVELADGTLRAFWFGGSREGAADVSIWTATLSPGAEAWSEPNVAISREDCEADVDRTIRKLGNPVAAIDGDGRLWMFFVSVSVGGWSGSAVNAVSSADEGQTWGPVERLVTSPFANISTLVKGPAWPLEDGAIGLPVYHEMVSKFPQILCIETDGNRAIVEGRQTPAGSRETIQPWVVPTSPTDAVTFFRRVGDTAAKVHVSRTSDSGKTWSTPTPCDLPNPNASVAAANLGGGRILLAFNDKDNSRKDLSLAITDDNGDSWTRLGSVETKKRLPDEKDIDRLEYSYPWLMRTRSGEVHLLYTWNRKQIRHLRLPRPSHATEEATP